MAESTGAETVWKSIAMFLAGALLAGGGSVIALARDSISRTEVNQMVHEERQQEEDRIKAVNAHLEHIDQTQVKTGKDIARIGQRLGVGTTPD